MSLSQKELDYYVSKAVASATKQFNEQWDSLHSLNTPSVHTEPEPAVNTEHPVLHASSTFPGSSINMVSVTKELEKLNEFLSLATATATRITQLLAVDAQTSTRSNQRHLVDCSTMTENPTAPGLSETVRSERSMETEKLEIQSDPCCSTPSHPSPIRAGKWKENAHPPPFRWKGQSESVDSCPVMGVKHAPRCMELFVFGVDKRTSSTDIWRYVENYVRVEQVRPISHVNARCRSFLVSVSMSDAKALMSPGFWPKYVGCRRFIRPMSGPLAKRFFGYRRPEQDDFVGPREL
jgi:hypothetical protein